MKTGKMILFIKFAMIFVLLQIRYVGFGQSPSKETANYIITFNPAYASGLLDIGFVSFENLYLIVYNEPLKIDSVMSVLGKKNYSSMLGILDTLRQTFKLYKLIENDSKTKQGNKINKKLNDCSNYGRRFLIPLSDTIKKSSSLVGFVVSRYILEGVIRYKIINENCGDFTNECRAEIRNL